MAPIPKRRKKSRRHAARQQGGVDSATMAIAWRWWWWWHHGGTAATAAARHYRGMTVAPIVTAVLPPHAATVAMKTPTAGSAASLAESPRWEVRRRWWQRQLAGSAAGGGGGGGGSGQGIDSLTPVGMAVAVAATVILPPRSTTVAKKTLALTAMAGAQTIMLIALKTQQGHELRTKGCS
jgi:hypothetical protein